MKPSAKIQANGQKNMYAHRPSLILRRTTLLSVDPGYISAFYVGDDDNILIVRTEQEKIEDDESYAEYDSDKFYNKTIVELQYYFRKNNKSVYYQIKNVLECLEVIYSEKDKQLSLFIKADEGIVLVLLELLESNQF